MNFLSQHLRDQVVLWLMVGSHVHIGLCDSVDAPEDVLHGGPRFLFHGNPLLMWLSQSPWMRARLFNPLPEIGDTLAV